MTQEYIDTLNRLLAGERLRLENMPPDTRFRFGNDAPLNAETVTRIRPLLMTVPDTGRDVLCQLSVIGAGIARMHIENAGKVQS